MCIYTAVLFLKGIELYGNNDFVNCEVSFSVAELMPYNLDLNNWE